MRRIYWDTMIYAYWLEGHAELGHRVQGIRERMSRRGDLLCGSIFVVGELLVRPLKWDDWQSVQAIEQFFDSPEVIMLPYPANAVRTFSELRAKHDIKALDAIHLAIAAHSGVDLFLTNDLRLQKISMPGLPFIASLDTDVL